MERLLEVDPDPGQEVLRNPELLAQIFSHFSQLQQVLAANGVCRQWRDVVKDVYIERHLRVVDLEPKSYIILDDFLRKVTVEFNADVDADGKFLFNQKYSTTDEKLCLCFSYRQPGFLISKLATSGWGANSNVVRLELVCCLTWEEWGEIGLIILKALRRCLKTVKVELMPSNFHPNRQQQHIPLCFRELANEWQQVEQRELAEANDKNQPPPLFDCPRLRQFFIGCTFEMLAVENAEEPEPEQQVELAELERFLRGGPREIFALCPNLQKFHSACAFGDGAGHGIQLLNGVFYRPLIENVEPDDHWVASFGPGFLDDPNEPALPPRLLQLLNHFVRDLFTAERRHPLRRLTSIRIPEVLSILIENPALCENLEAVKFWKLHNQPQDHIEYLTSTRDLQNMRRLYWSLDLRAQVDLENEGFQLNPLEADQQPIFPNLQVFYLYREREPEPKAVVAPSGGFVVENWLRDNYQRLAPNIHRFVINVYTLEYNTSDWKGYKKDIQNGLRMASSLQVKQLVLVVQHATAPDHTAHNLLPEEAIPCLKGIESLTVTAVTPALLISLGEFFIGACQPGRPSQDPRINSTIRRIELYQYPDRHYVQPGLIPFQLDQLTVTIPEGLEVVGGEGWSWDDENLEGPPPPPAPAPAHVN